MTDIFGGPTMQDLAELWKSQDYVYETHTYPIGETRTDGPTVEPGPSRTAPDAPKPSEPIRPTQNRYAAAWQCGGCGTWYSYFVSHCDCQKRNMVTSGNSTNAKLEMP